MLDSIIVVDDLDSDRYIAKWFIEQHKLADKVYEARDGQEALNLFQDAAQTESEIKSPSLVLLDINMPIMNGFEFLQKFQDLKKNSGNSFYDSIVIVMFTSSSLSEDQEKALKYEFVKGYLTKPIEVESLKELIQENFKKE